MHFSAFNNSPCAESVLEGSDLELEYFQAQTSGFSLSAPFEPKGASTPLNTSNNSWNECYQENPPRNLRHESRHSSGPSSELRVSYCQTFSISKIFCFQNFPKTLRSLNKRQITTLRSLRLTVLPDHFFAIVQRSVEHYMLLWWISASLTAVAEDFANLRSMKLGMNQKIAFESAQVT